jgi:hypothetical protein
LAVIAVLLTRRRFLPYLLPRRRRLLHFFSGGLDLILLPTAAPFKGNLFLPAPGAFVTTPKPRPVTIAQV